MKLLQKDFSSLEEIELQQHADNFFIEIKRELYQNLIPWKQLINKEPQEIIFDNFSLKGISNKIWRPSVLILSDQEKKGPNNEDYRLFVIKVLFQAKKAKYEFSYKVFAQKTASAEIDPKKSPNLT